MVLPCEPDQFRDFIAGLLGRPQTITRRLAGPFELNHANAENLFHLLEQRLNSQNGAQLIQFTARITFDDNSSVLLNTFEEFQAYREIKPLISTGAHFSWIYLIKFQDKKFPEKQQIDISFTTSSALQIVERGTFEIARRLGQSIRIQINHTNRTWGTDIESLLVGQLKTLIKSETGLRALVARWAGRIGFGVAALTFASTLAMAFQVTDGFINRYLAAAKQFADRDVATFEIIAKKVDFLTQVIASGMWTRYAFFIISAFIIALIVSIALGIMVGTNAGADRPSFVLLSERAVDARTIALKSYRNSWLIFLITLMGSLAISIAENYLFYKLSQLWTL